MIKKFILALSLCLISSVAYAQTKIAPTIEKVGSLEAYITQIGESNDTVVIGDMKDPTKFSPDITFTKWSNECQLKIIPDKSWFTGTPTLSTDGKELMIDGDVGFYYKPYGKDVFKFGLILNAPPSKDRIVTIDGVEYYQWQFKMEGWEEFDFDYKYPWVNGDGEEIYTRIVNGYQKGRKSGAHGGYEVWHKTKRDYIIGKTNYMFGMIGFFYRPIFKDSSGRTKNAILKIEHGEYIVLILKSWADGAAYPVVANDTFGNTGTPQDYTTLIGDNAEVGKYTLSVAGDVSKLTAYLDASANTRNVKGIIHDDDGTSGRPDTLIAVSNPSAITTTAGYFDLTFSSAVPLSSGNWWLGIIVETSSIMFSERSSGGTAEADGATNYDTPPDWEGSSLGSINPCIYATYTPSGGGATPRRRIIIISKHENTIPTRCMLSDCYIRRKVSRTA